MNLMNPVGHIGFCYEYQIFFRRNKHSFPFPFHKSIFSTPNPHQMSLNLLIPFQQHLQFLIIMDLFFSSPIEKCTVQLANYATF
jgi:hypothetical protein